MDCFQVLCEFNCVLGLERTALGGNSDLVDRERHLIVVLSCFDRCRGVTSTSGKCVTGDQVGWVVTCVSSGTGKIGIGFVVQRFCTS